MNIKDQAQVNEIVSFWFSEENKSKRFIKDADFDQIIIQKFKTLHRDAIEGRLNHWKGDPEGCLAFIILIDQFSRNMFRDTPKSFEYDSLALSTTKFALEQEYDTEMSNDYKMFLYMPLMHSEDIEDQALSVNLFAQISQDNFYALRHKEIIELFGRFPHRNLILGRESTVDEISFLKEPNSSF